MVKGQSATFEAGSFRLEGRRIEHDGDVEVRGKLGGVTLAARIPRNAQLLMVSRTSSRPITVDPRLFLDDDTMRIVPVAFRPRAWKLVHYNRTISAETGTTSSLSISFETRSVCWQLNGVEVFFTKLALLWVIGFPDDPSMRNVHAQAAGLARIARVNFEASIGFTPALTFTAGRRRLRPRTVARLARLFGLRLVSSEDPNPPFECQVMSDSRGIRMLVSDGERSQRWE